jgi:hypothetical protein
MLKDRIKFLGICILISSIILSISITFYSLCNRYYFVEGDSITQFTVFDRLDGTAYFKRGVNINKVNCIEEYRNK